MASGARLLHNGAVPTLTIFCDLLGATGQILMSVATGYDFDRLACMRAGLLPDGRRTARLASPLQFEFDTGTGNSNLGHEFGTDLSIEPQALLEY